MIQDFGARYVVVVTSGTAGALGNPYGPNGRAVLAMMKLA